ncbi:MAG: phosphoesterase [Rhizobiales bacterium 24-66-13]|jgi:DNA ligase-associated metallophosphoesterase|nr:MAG: phosphoesterase [Rhizobiales bacterium 24-66-13]HQS09728.1 ligase-associated DNA damage response endonuclease PdeM [Xanthobacteraceae bacterium]HQS46652.1 ligase-associated DNA damage response endonuclease PdeM [Xanthobacteraceae bacterium]
MLARADSVPPSFVGLAGAELVLDRRGALAWPERGVLAVADLHLEKASAFARRGQMLPPYDSADTLARLEALIARWAPALVIALGDTLHDRWAQERIAPQTRDRLAALQRGRSFIWIAGNHDPEPNALLEGEWAREIRIGPLTFRHEPLPGEVTGEVAGHLHPVARLVQRGHSIRRRCFATDGMRMVLPALGSLTGGLNVRHPAVSGLFGGRYEAHMLGTARTYRIAADACLGD